MRVPEHDGIMGIRATCLFQSVEFQWRWGAFWAGGAEQKLVIAELTAHVTQDTQNTRLFQSSDWNREVET